MLEKKIAEAKQKNKQQRNQLILGSLLVAVLSAFFIYVVTFFKITPREQVISSTVQDPAPKLFTEEIKEDAHEESHVEIEEVVDSNVLAINNGTKDKFIEILKNYETSTETQLNKIDLEVWDKEKYLYVTDTKEDAIYFLKSLFFLLAIKLEKVSCFANHLL